MDSFVVPCNIALVEDRQTVAHPVCDSAVVPLGRVQEMVDSLRILSASRGQRRECVAIDHEAYAAVAVDQSASQEIHREVGEAV